MEDTNNVNLEDIKPSRKRREQKLTKAERARIRYQLYRENGYSVEEARKLRYRAYVDISGIRVDRETGKIIKKRNYKQVKKTVYIDDEFNNLRKIEKAENNTTFHPHGWLLQSKKYQGRYEEAVARIRRRDKLSNDQAHYFAYFMMDSGYSYEFTRTELLSSREFEQYDKLKKQRETNKHKSVLIGKLIKRTRKAVETEREKKKIAKRRIKRKTKTPSKKKKKITLLFKEEN